MLLWSGRSVYSLLIPRRRESLPTPENVAFSLEKASRLYKT